MSLQRGVEVVPRHLTRWPGVTLRAGRSYITGIAFRSWFARVTFLTLWSSLARVTFLTLWSSLASLALQSGEEVIRSLAYVFFLC